MLYTLALLVKGGIAGKLVNYLIGAFAIFTLYPMLRAVLMGFEEKVGFSGTQWEWVGISNFVEAITDDARMLLNLKGETLKLFGREIFLPVTPGVALKNFFYYTVGSLATQIPIGFALA